MSSGLGLLDSTKLRPVATLDAQILGATTGQEAQLLAWMDERAKAVQACLMQSPSVAEVEELQDRTRRLEEHFLHWRRAAIMELSQVDQHLKFLGEQQSSNNCSRSIGFDYSA